MATPALRAFHSTAPLCANTTSDASSMADQQVRSDDNETPHLEGDGEAYRQDRHVANADALLRETFGPQAKIAVHRLTQRRPRHQPSPPAATPVADGAHDEANLPASAAQHSGEKAEAGVYYRAAATFRLLGFPVELAVANGPRVQETIDNCLRQAMSSDITFIRPSSSQRNNNNNSSSYQQKNHGKNNQQERWNQRGGRHRNNSQQHSSNDRGGGAVRSGFASVDAESAAAAAASPRGARLTPHQMEMRSILDDLRQLCAHFSRTVKFSIKPPSSGSRTAAESGGSSSTQNRQPAASVDGGDEDNADDAATQEREMARRQWRCRCYVKEEWGTTTQARLAHEVTGSSPNDALVRCVSQLRHEYREEMESPAVMEEGVREVAGAVEPQHKTVTALCAAETPNAAARAQTTNPPALTEVPTFRAHVDVADRRGNVATYTVKRQATQYTAYEAASLMALRGEALWDSETSLLSQSLAPPPLLWRLRWQLDLLVDHICRETGQVAEEVAWVEVKGETQPGKANETTATPASEGGNALPEAEVPFVPARFTGSLFSERNVLVWQTSGGGRYRVEFDTYVQALYHLLDQYADCLATLPCMARGNGEGLLFPNAAVLDLYVHRHDAFPILQHHHGNINVYALLGALTAQLLGCPFGTHYHFDRATGEHTATLTVNDGRVGQQPLIQRRSKMRGEAWRDACLDAIRENFPRQYAAILDRHPEVDLASEDVTRSAHMRALPRDKRLPYFGSLSAMVFAFAEEDLGWRQARVRLRNQGESLGFPNWVAELEALVDGEEQRRVVAVSPLFSQMQSARRSLIYRIAAQYFPQEMAMYKALGRTDVINPEEETGRRSNRFFMPNATMGASMLNHVVALMEARQPSIAPVRFTVEARLATRTSQTAADEVDPFDLHHVEGDTMQLLSEDPMSLLRPLRLAYTARVVGNRGDLLIADFDSDSATTAADAHAVPVLVTALKSASFHICGGDAEALWTEYETEPLPPVTTTGALILALFDRFMGAYNTSTVSTAAATSVVTAGTQDGVDGAAVAASPSTPTATATADAAAALAAREADETSVNYNASVTVVTKQIGDYWFGTAVLPQLGMLPIARAVATTKRKCVRNALIVATRRSFPRILQYAAKHDLAVSPFATEVLAEPIVEHLSESAARDLRAHLARKRSLSPLPPFRLLLKCTKESYPDRERFIRVQRTHNTTHGFQCRLYLQRSKAVRKGDTQLVGYGASATSPSAALHLASIMALENLHEVVLRASIAVQPDYCDPPKTED